MPRPWTVRRRKKWKRCARELGARNLPEIAQNPTAYPSVEQNLQQSLSLGKFGHRWNLESLQNVLEKKIVQIGAILGEIGPLKVTSRFHCANLREPPVPSISCKKKIVKIGAILGETGAW